MPPSTFLTQLCLARVPQSSTTTLRHFSRQTTLRYPRKDSQDKDSINTEATEYSKSGSDDQSARNQDAAFDPDVTSPEGEKDAAGKGKGGNPLDVSPANREVSKPRGEQEGGAESSGGNGKRSGFGSGEKGGS